MIRRDTSVHMKTFEQTCGSPDETFALGFKLGSSLSGGEVILLEGPLGAGKTLFTKGILEGLDFDISEVTSPSFTLINIYDARHRVFHVDLWRTESPASAVHSIGLYELLEEPGAVIVIEWAEQLGDFRFPEVPYRVTIKGDGDDPRTVTLYIPENGVLDEAV